MLCGVTATLGSNPSATATAARPQWGRAVLLCLGDVLCCCVAPRVFRAPEGQVAWSAGGRRPAREIATREPDGSEWSISRPALALPPPTGTAAVPRHSPWVSQPGPPNPPAPSTPVVPGR